MRFLLQFHQPLISILLVAAVTILLAIGVARMAQRPAIIRRMPAVETLGSTTVICSDKTGTLTQNQMTVTTIVAGGEMFSVSGSGYAPEGEITADGTALSVADMHGRVALLECLRAGVLCNDARVLPAAGNWVVEGDPTEAALLVVGPKAGIQSAALHEETPRIDSIPFESERQYMATLHDQGLERPRVVYAKGSVEAILARCDAAVDADGDAGGAVTGREIEPLDDAALPELAEMAAVFARVVPEQKLWLVRALHTRGHVVAITGTASTTPRPSSRPTSASRWERGARTSPARPSRSRWRSSSALSCRSPRCRSSGST